MNSQVYVPVCPNDSCLLLQSSREQRSHLSQIRQSLAQWNRCFSPQAYAVSRNSDLNLPRMGMGETDEGYSVSFDEIFLLMKIF